MDDPCINFGSRVCFVLKRPLRGAPHGGGRRPGGRTLGASSEGVNRAQNMAVAPVPVSLAHAHARTLPA